MNISNKTILILLFIILGSSSVQAQYLISSELLESYTASELSLIPTSPATFDAELYKIVYNTTDAVGEPTIASGAFARPTSGDCTEFPIAIYFHGTTLNKEDVPSRINGETIICTGFAGQGFYSLAPDYVGMGDSPGLHPYQHAASEATAGIDMLRAVREFLAQEGASDNGQVMLTGYSQGGHAAMAMHKYVEDNELLAEIDVVASCPASGAYDMSGSQTNTILSGEPYSNPGYIVYVMAAYELAYGNIYNSYSDILASPYDVDVVPFFDGNNTTYTMGDLNPLLPNLISELMTPEAYEAFANDSLHPLREALRDNDVYDWSPQRPLRMYYCTADEQVAFTNTTTAYDAMIANGAADVTAFNLGPFDHGGCVPFSLIGIVGHFNSIRIACQPNSTDEYERLGLELYPNPSSDWIEIRAGKSIAGWLISDMTGRQVAASKTMKSSSASSSGNLKIDIAELVPGQYILSIHQTNGSELSQGFEKK